MPTKPAIQPLPSFNLIRPQLALTQCTLPFFGEQLPQPFAAPQEIFRPATDHSTNGRSTRGDLRPKFGTFLALGDLWTAFFQAKERMRMFPKKMVKIIQYPCKSIVNYGIFYVVTAFFVPRFSWIRMNLWLFMCKKQASIIGPWLSNKSGSIWKLIPLYLAVTAHLEYIMTHSICSLTLHDDSVTSLLSLR